ASRSEFPCAGRSCGAGSTDFACRSLLMGCCTRMSIAATFRVASKATSNEFSITCFARYAKESFAMLPLTQRTSEDGLKAAFLRNQVRECNRFQRLLHVIQVLLSNFADLRERFQKIIATRQQLLAISQSG